MVDLYIIIPIYNAAKTIERTVFSLACIDPGNRYRVQVIAVDDGSIDASAAVFERAAANVAGINWTLLRRQNGGSGAARNDALRSFISGWTLCLDADDELIADPFHFIDTQTDATALLFAAEFYREGKRLTRMPVRWQDGQRLPEIFSARNPFPILSVIFRRELLDNIFAEDLRYLEDWHFLATNPRLFARCAVYRDSAIGRVHGSKQSKSADQYKNGYYRVIVAERLSQYWADEKHGVVRNNLAIQGAIGKIQMGERLTLKTLMLLPATASLYAKLLIYLFFYRLYLRFYPYA